MQKTVLILCAILLLLLSGCIDSLPPDKRLYCLDLTEKSYAFVPECKSQQQCFSLLEKRLFGFDESSFSSEVQTKMYSYKNNAALSWLHFNRSKQSVAEMHAICSKNTSIGMLAFHLNELTHSMSKAFEYSSLANKDSFAILLLEHSDLQQEDISLVKEEPLFNDFALIASNLNQLSGETACNSQTQSYGCLYLGQAAGFQSLAMQTGFQNRVVSEASIFDLLGPYTSTIGRQAELDLSIPLVEALPQLVSYLSTLFKSRQAIEGLERVPAFQFMQSYNAFMGTENSCLSRFSEIMKSDAAHRQALLQRSQALELQASSGIEAAQKSVNALDSEHYASFDANFFEQLYTGLGQQSQVAAQQYGISDFGELSLESELKLQGFRQRLRQLQEQDFLQVLSLGEKLSSLKELNQEIALLRDNIGYLEAEVVNGLIVLCDERALLIEQSLEDAKLPEKQLLEAADLKARSLFRLNQFKDAGSKKEKMMSCRELVDDFSVFSAALEDFESHSLQQQIHLQDCFSFLESVFDSASQGSLNLDSFLLRYNELKQIQEPYADVAAVQRLCISLQEDTKTFLKKHPDIISIEENFLKAKEIMPVLHSVNSRNQSILPDKRMDSLASQLSYFEGFFSGGQLVLEKALPLLPDLQSGLAEFVSSLDEEAKAGISEFVQQNALISIELPEITPVGMPFDETVSIELDNIFNYGIEGPLTLELAFDKPVGSLIFSSPNVFAFRDSGSSLAIDLNGLSQGKTLLRFSTSNIVEKSESTALVSAASNEAVFSKTIEIDCSRRIPLLQVRTRLIDAGSLSFANILVLQQERSLRFSLQDSDLTFFVEECLGKESVNILFSVMQPVGLTWEPFKKSSQGSMLLQSYKVHATNRLPIELTKVKVFLPLNQDENSISRIGLLDSEAKELEFSLLPDGNIAFSLALLKPYQKVLLFLDIYSNTFQPALQPAEAEQPAQPAKVEEIRSKIEALTASIAESEANLALLEQLFASVTEEQLISAKYISPISRTELDKIKLNLNSLGSFLSKSQLQGFASLAEEGNIDSALKKAESFVPQLAEKQQEADAIASRLQSAIEAIQEDAVASYNSTAELFNQGIPNEEAASLLENAKTELLNGSLLKSIVDSKSAALLASPKQEENALPIFLLPVFGCIALLLFVRIKKKSVSKQRKSLIKRIEKTW